jgi:hypothetical protein
MSQRHNGGHRGSVDETRRRIAVEAARLIAEDGLRDYHDAKRKAALRLGIGDDAALPRNGDIEEALREHQRLFQSATQPAHLARLRRTAIDAMRFLARFEPRLVGAVLEGTADAHSTVHLHLFCDDPREVTTALADQRIPYEEKTRTLRSDSGRDEDHLALLLGADGVPVELTLFEVDDLRQAPLDRVTSKPMRRARLASVEILVEQT